LKNKIENNKVLTKKPRKKIIYIKNKGQIKKKLNYNLRTKLKTLTTFLKGLRIKISTCTAQKT